MQHILVGKTISAIFLAEDQKAIKFQMRGPNLTDMIDITALCDGDCCSHSWIENVENPAGVIGSPVLVAENIDMPGGSDDGELKCYGFKIETAQGTCIIDFRNHSNGYYGGNLSWPGNEDYFYGGVFEQNKSKQEWKRL